MGMQAPSSSPGSACPPRECSGCLLCRLVPLFRDLISLEPGHLKDVSQGLKVVAFGKFRQLVGKRGNVESRFGSVCAVSLVAGHEVPSMRPERPRTKGISFLDMFFAKAT